MLWDTGKDILSMLLSRAGELEIEKTEFPTEARNYVQCAYWDTCGEFPWLWNMRYPATMFTTVPAIKTIGVILDTATTLMSIPFDPGSVAGRKVMIDNDGAVMRIVSNDMGALTLGTTYVRAITSEPVTIFQDEYAPVVDLLIPQLLRSAKTGREIEFESNNQMIAERQMRPVFNTAKRASYVTDTVFKLWPAPMEAEIFEFFHTYLPPTLDFTGAVATDTPILPRNLRSVITDRALYYLLTDMDDNRADVIYGNAMVRLAEEKSRQNAKFKSRFFIPRQFRLSRS